MLDIDEVELDLIVERSLANVSRVLREAAEIGKAASELCLTDFKLAMKAMPVADASDDVRQAVSRLEREIVRYRKIQRRKCN